MFRAQAVHVTVPASSANLGPGYDALALALSLRDELIVQVTDEPGLTVDVAGEGADTVRTDEKNLVVRALRSGFKALGGQPRGLAVICANRIPHGRGLGSSAAAIVAGLTAARWLTVGGDERLPDAQLLALAVGIEGHPDNVAAALRGRLSLAWQSDGTTQSLSLPVAEDVLPVAFVPSTQFSTAKARRLLPEQVSHADAAFEAGRAALLVAALTREPALLLAATEDRIHQQYRAPAMPRSATLVSRLRAAAVPAVVSGAGPTVLALTRSAELDRVISMAPKGFAVHSLEVDGGVVAQPYRP
jgi:homoserine kinase